MMKRMLGFWAGCCAAAGVLAGPASCIIIVAPSRVAQERLSQPDFLRDGPAIEDDLANMVLNMTTLSLL
jgi:hypothetical protein